ncbi:glycoside hydrolase family 5 protein [Mucilaginibacter myungsuensis]|uniref:Glycoside hydrolase family 5 protein n=1 Tax=Mucilaginibacter myungsuensis TaxID=649104 RepID=A0A929PY81_9SPHI|nr:glycoside hydrolase family 5 protein [Mucilaginibacter myungsuensis]MBE9663904.1 glycoside hydrolase family 5 protein [Mucilaginibacter myungsuensis]MDN3598380.1 glycoside hydrolase family 5 protein [Mucilaginibacter myungsuensis]
MFKNLTIALLLIVVTTLTVSAQSATPVSKHGQLKVSDGRIVDKNGRPPQLRGVSLFWSIWEGKKFYTPEVVNWLVKDFNISLIRVSMAVEENGGYIQDPSQQQLAIAMVDAAIKQGIYVIIDWHDHHANKNVEKSRAFFGRMAKKYVGIPNVIYEIWNEPEEISWQIVKQYAVTVIPEIRKHDKNNIIVVGSPSWDQHVDVVAADRIKGFDNIAYSFHFYASDPYHQDELRKRGDAAIAAKLPLFVTEWGVGESNGNGVFDIDKTNKWLNWMEKNQLSWTDWSIVDKKETTAILMPGASVKGGWAAKDLSLAGTYIRSRIIKLNGKQK